SSGPGPTSRSRRPTWPSRSWRSPTMDSAPATPEAGRATGTFGGDLARRGAPRIGVRRRAAGHRFVGAVGRASAGFGRAVGRSTTVRPVVDRANLDSHALRPPPGWWQHEATGDEEPPATWTA